MSGIAREPYRWMPLADGASLRVEIGASRDRARLGGSSAEIETEWARLRAQNPRYFNGPILKIDGFEAAKNLIRAQRGEFKHLAVRPVVDTGVAQLGVTGVLETRDAHGKPAVFVGKRSESTRIFGGMWESAPSGGVDPPPMPGRDLDWKDLWRSLADEMHEELGLPVEPDPVPPVALLDDPMGGSVEVVFRVLIEEPVVELTVGEQAGPNRWEYDDVRWVGVEALAAFARTEPVIAATKTIWRGLGWIG